ncbi:MAG: hypothetical protein AAGI30_04535 [Planctomycetota bacterium]
MQTREARERAIAFVEHHARPVDRASLRIHLDQGNQDELIEALARFQNPDGGFGNAMEPDFRVPMSSVTATTVAFQYLIGHDVPASEPIVERGLSYLLKTYDTDAHAWPPVCPKIEDYPRARWWNLYQPVRYAPEQADWANPNIEVVGIFNRYREHVPCDLLALLNERAMLWLAATETAEPHGVLCAMRYVESLAPAQQEILLVSLSKQVLSVVKLEEERWIEYEPQPVWYARRPDALVAGIFKTALHQNLEFVARQQHHNGSWQPTWHWGRDEEAWEQAKAEWAGTLTVSNLKMLDAFA